MKIFQPLHSTYVFEPYNLCADARPEATDSIESLGGNADMSILSVKYPVVASRYLEIIRPSQLSSPSQEHKHELGTCRFVHARIPMEITGQRRETTE